VHTEESANHPLTWREVREHAEHVDLGARVWLFYPGSADGAPVVNLDWHPGHSAYLTLWAAW
jgi:hypothetical protein